MEKHDDSYLCLVLRDDVEPVGGGVVHQPHIIVISEGPQEKDVVSFTPLPRGQDPRLGILGCQIPAESPVSDEGAAQ